MSQEFQCDYLIRLPLPLAQLYQRAYNDKSAQSRHNNTFYLFEALVKLAAAPAVAAYLHEVEHGTPRVAALDRQLVHLAFPSLGQWVGMLRALALHFGTRTDAAAHPLGHLWDQLNRPRRDCPGLLALFRRIKNGLNGAAAGDESCSPMQVLNALVPYRNAVFGHGAGRFESFYEHEMGPLLFPAANEILAEGVLDVLGPRGSRLVHLAELRMLDEDRVEVGLRELVGEHSGRVAPLILDRSQASALVPDRVAVLWPGRPVPLRLDPLLLYRERELGEEVLFLNRDRNGRQVEYPSYTRGEPERDRATAPALAALLGLVTGREVGVEQLEAFTQQSVAETPSVEVLLGSPSSAGRVLGDYEILAEIGRGGMGVVLLARQLSLGRLVALKMLPADLAGDDAALARFRREMRLLARCDHPHIVKVLASGTFPDGQLYYAMEYVFGTDLEQVWREVSGAEHSGGASTLSSSTWASAVLSASRRTRDQTTTRPTADGQTPALPMPPLPDWPSSPDDPGGYARRVALLMRDAALALQTIHEQQVVHRDLKPANLMLTPDGSRVVLMDFGLAKGQSLSLSASGTGGLLGTLRYAAPEQLAAASLEVGPPADVRGLGVTLWELLTRRRLFAEAEDERQLAACVYDRDLPRLRTIDPGFDRDLEAIVARATERRACDRIAVAGQLAEYLQLYLDGKTLPIRPPTPAEMAGRWVLSHGPLVGSSAAALLAIVTTVVIAFMLITQSRDAAVKEAIHNERLATYNKGLVQIIKRSVEVEKKRAEDAQKHRIESQQRLVNLYQERGQALCAEGRVDHGLLCLAKALKEVQDVPFADDQQRILRRLIGCWLSQTHALLMFMEHQGSVNAAAFSPDGRSVLTGSRDWTARLWDAATGQPIGPPMKHQDSVNVAAFSPDGRSVLTGSSDGTAGLWDAGSGQPVGPLLTHQNPVIVVAFSPDGKFLLTGSRDSTAQLWDAATGQPIGQPMEHRGAVNAVAFSPDGQPIEHRGAVNAAAFSPDGKSVLTGSQDRTARLWDAATGQLIGPPMEHQGAVNAVAFSPDGKSVLTGSEDTTARLWDAATGHPIGPPMKHESFVNAAVFSPDGKSVLTGSYDTTARLWDAATGHPIGPPMKDQGPVTAVAISPDGKYVLTGSEDTTARLWGAATGQSVAPSLKHDSSVNVAVFSPDGRSVLTGSQDRTARLCGAATGQPLGMPMEHQGSVNTAAFSPDGRSVLTGSSDGITGLWDASSGQPIGPPLEHQGSVNVVAFSPDGKFLLTGSRDRTARLWDAATGQPVGAPMEHQSFVKVAAFSPDGRSVLTSSQEWTAQFWSVVTGQPIGQPMEHHGFVNAVAFSPDGRSVLTGSQDRTARLWSVATGQPIGAPMKHQSFVNAVAFSPDGRSVLTGSQDTTAQLWGATTGLAVGPPLKHQGTVTAVAFSPNGMTVLTGSEDTTARLWDAATGQPVGSPLKHQGPVSAVAFSPDGKSVLTVTGWPDVNVRVREVPESVVDGLDQIVLRIEVNTGKFLNSSGAVDWLDFPMWYHRRRLIKDVGAASPVKTLPPLWVQP